MDIIRTYVREGIDIESMLSSIESEIEDDVEGDIVSISHQVTLSSLQFHVSVILVERE